MKLLQLSFGVFCVGTLGASALGGSTVSLLNDFRGVTMDYDIAWFDDLGGIAGFNQQRSWAPTSEYEDFAFDQSDVLGDTASMHVIHDSSVSDVAFVGSGSAHATSNPDPEIDYLIFGMYGASSYNVEFSISEETDFALDVDLFSSSDDFDIESFVYLIDLSDNSFRFQTSAGVGELAVQEQLTLETGSYRFIMQAKVGPNDVESEQSASFDGGLRVVPAPSGLMLIAGGGLFAARRRR